MKRRGLLASVCASLVGVAGCSSRGADSDPGATATDSPASPSPSPSPSPTSPTPLSAFECPPRGSDTGAAVCSHTVETDSASVYLLPAETNADAPGETLELTLYNDSATDLRFNPYQWSILSRDGSKWERVEKRASGNGRVTVAAGETKTWTFGDAVEFVNPEATIDAGTYAAGIDVPNPDDGSDWIRCFALFRLA